MRQRISDRNVFPRFNIPDEYHKLHGLFCDKSAFGKSDAINGRLSPIFSYNDCLNALFLDWDLRGTFTSLTEMYDSLQISEFDFMTDPTEDRLLDYIQFVFNAVAYVNHTVKHHVKSFYRNGDTIFNAIIDNCTQTLIHLNARIETEGSECFVVYKDDVAAAISEKHPEFRDSIVTYLKIDNRGDLTRKGEILCTLAKRLEPYEKKLNSTEFKKLCNDTTFLLNKTGARHNASPEDPYATRFADMSIEELEPWYDSAFSLFLACMAVMPYLETKKEIQRFKESVND